MKNFFLIILLGVFLYNPASAQTGDLLIKNGPKGFFLEHATAAKENYFSIGRLYHVHPRFIASFNSLDMNKGLSLGQQILIPLTDSNFNQQVNKGAPVYYVAGEKENLSKISSANKVRVEKLKFWNNLSEDNIVAGKKLIVGFLVSGELAVQKEITIKTGTPVVAVQVNNKPVTQVVKEQNEPKKEEEKSNPIVKEEIKATEPVFTKVKEEVKTTVNEEGFFKSHFNRQIVVYPISKEVTVTSGIFKTTSGWQDKKYFVLMDKVEPGMIVKVTNPSNFRIIYAKVLYSMEGTRQNQGLDIRMSNAAADALGIADTEKFIVKVKYTP